MNSLCIFLNTRVENSGVLAAIGDRSLTPFRYFFNGKTIRIQPRDLDGEIEVHHVASFHKKGVCNCSRTNLWLKSSSTGVIKTILSIVFLIPGLILGAAFKGLSYLSSDVREKHRLAKEHWTPINRKDIGSVSNPIANKKQLVQALEAERISNSKNRPINALIIHGNGTLTINEDPGILQFNPKKLVLEGARIVCEPSATGRLENAMIRLGKWEIKTCRVVTESNIDESFVITHPVATIDAALQDIAPRISKISSKRYHRIFAVPRPQAS